MLWIVLLSWKCLFVLWMRWVLCVLWICWGFLFLVLVVVWWVLKIGLVCVLFSVWCGNCYWCWRVSVLFIRCVKFWVILVLLKIVLVWLRLSCWECWGLVCCLYFCCCIFCWWFVSLRWIIWLWRLICKFLIVIVIWLRVGLILWLEYVVLRLIVWLLCVSL